MVKFSRKINVSPLLNRKENVPLYHATTHAREIVQQGFKTRGEIGDGGGLGGREMDEMVSFTTSPVLAANIAADLQTMVDIAQGKVNIDNICEELNKRDWREDKFYGDSFDENVNPCTVWKDSGVESAIKLDLKGSHVWAEGKSEEEVRRIVLLGRFSSWYVKAREGAGGRPDPIIFGAEVEHFSDPSINVGVVETSADLPFSLVELWDDERQLYEKLHPSRLWNTDVVKTEAGDIDASEYNTGDHFLREVAVNRNRLKSAPKLFDLRQLSATDFKKMQEEWDDLKAVEYAGRWLESFIWECARDYGQRHPQKWYDGNVYAMEPERVLASEEQCAEVLREAMDKCVYPGLGRTRRVCEKLFGTIKADE